MAFFRSRRLPIAVYGNTFCRDQRCCWSHPRWLTVASRIALRRSHRVPRSSGAGIMARSAASPRRSTIFPCRLQRLSILPSGWRGERKSMDRNCMPGRRAELDPRTVTLVRRSRSVLDTRSVGGSCWRLLRRIQRACSINARAENHVRSRQAGIVPQARDFACSALSGAAKSKAKLVRVLRGSIMMSGRSARRLSNSWMLDFGHLDCPRRRTIL